MIFEAKNNRQVCLRIFCSDDTDHLCNYLQVLSEITKSRFGPHGFDRQSIIDIEYNGLNDDMMLDEKTIIVHQ